MNSDYMDIVIEDSTINPVNEDVILSILGAFYAAFAVFMIGMITKMNKDHKKQRVL